MGSVRASGAPDGSRRQRETTHAVFSSIYSKLRAGSTKSSHKR